MPKQVDYSGMRFSNLTLITRSRKGGPGVGAIWHARCDCGSTREVIAKDVVAGKLKTCGKCEYSSRLKQGKALLQVKGKGVHKRAWRHAVQECMSRGRSWELQWDQFVEIITGSCSYCGAEPRHKDSGEIVNHTKLDLIDPEKSYTLDNCTSICAKCKGMKRQDNYVNFLEHIAKIGRHLGFMV